MKKLLSVLLTFILVCSVIPVNADYNYNEEYPYTYDGYHTYLYAMHEAYEYGIVDLYDGQSLKDIPEDQSQWAAEMLLTAGKDFSVNEEEATKVRDEYNLSPLYYVFDKESLEKAVEFKFNLSVEEIQAKNPSGIMQKGNYWVVEIGRRGVRWPEAHFVIDNLTELSSNTVYAQWHYTDYHDNYKDRTDDFYAILKKGVVDGKTVMAYRYLGTTPPSDDILLEYSAPDISVVLDCKKLDFDQNPVLENNRTLVPLRAIFEALGATVSWNDDTKTVTAVKGDTEIKLTIGTYEMYKNNEKISLDVSPIIINGRTLVPVRAISEAFSCEVNWISETQTVEIISDSDANSKQKQILTDYLNNEFSKNEILTQSEPYMTIEYDTNLKLKHHTVKDYSFIDIDADGLHELIVSSRFPDEDYEKYCFSILDCDENGNVKHVLVKSGQESRLAYRYFIAEYDGKKYILETTGMGNSVSRTKIRNLYTYDGSQIIPGTKLYFDERYEPECYDEQIFTINGKDVGKEAVIDLMLSVDEDYTRLYTQLGYSQP